MDQATYNTTSFNEHIEAFNLAFITTINQYMKSLFDISHKILMRSENTEDKRKFNKARLKLYDFAKAHKSFVQLKSYLITECNGNIAELQFGNLDSVETYLDYNDVLEFCIKKHEIQENCFYEDYVIYPYFVFNEKNYINSNCSQGSAF